MTAQELIDKLNELDDKSIDVAIADSGYIFPITGIEPHDNYIELL